MATPMPMPIFAPLLRLDVLGGDGEVIGRAAAAEVVVDDEGGGGGNEEAGGVVVAVAMEVDHVVAERSDL